MCPLLGLAPGGVCHASPVTSAAVGSYPTLSPLPLGRSLRAVYFLWHFPSAHAGRLLAVALSTWSPDFPPVWGYPHTSGCPAIWSGGGYRGFGGGVQMGERNENERCAWGFPPPPLRGSSPATQGRMITSPSRAQPRSGLTEGGSGTRFQNARRHDTLASVVPSRVFRIGLPRHCASTRYRSSIDIRLWRQSVRADYLTSPSGPGRSPFQAHGSVSVAAVHNRGVAGTRLTACACHCWHSLLGHRLRIAPRYGIRPRLAGSSSRLTAIACFVPSSPPGPFAPPVSRLCS